MATQSVGFPEDKVRAAFAEWWRVEQQDAADLAADAPPPKRPISVLTPIVEIDSHRAVRALLEAEKVVSFKVPPRIVKLGGYTSADEMVEHLVSELKKLFIKKQEKANA